MTSSLYEPPEDWLIISERSEVPIGRPFRYKWWLVIACSFFWRHSYATIKEVVIMSKTHAHTDLHFVWARITIYEIMGSIDLFNYNILSKVFSFPLLLITVFFDNSLWYILLFYRHHLKSNEYNKRINGDSVHELSVSQSSQVSTLLLCTASNIGQRYLV